LQESALIEAKVFVLPNPSGLQAQYQLPEMIEIFGELRSVVVRKKV
jgi:TDG/mug DNA glycosylase family protein